MSRLSGASPAVSAYRPVRPSHLQGYQAVRPATPRYTSASPSPRMPISASNIRQSSTSSTAANIRPRMNSSSRPPAMTGSAEYVKHAVDASRFASPNTPSIRPPSLRNSGNLTSSPQPGVSGQYPPQYRLNTPLRYNRPSTTYPGQLNTPQMNSNIRSSVGSRPTQLKPIASPCTPISETNQSPVYSQGTNNSMRNSSSNKFNFKRAGQSPVCVNPTQSQSNVQRNSIRHLAPVRPKPANPTSATSKPAPEAELWQDGKILLPFNFV